MTLVSYPPPPIAFMASRINTKGQLVVSFRVGNKGSYEYFTTTCELREVVPAPIVTPDIDTKLGPRKPKKGEPHAIMKLGIMEFTQSNRKPR